MIRKTWNVVDTWLVSHPWVAVLMICAGGALILGWSVYDVIAYPCR